MPLHSIPRRQPLRPDSPEPRRGTGWEGFMAMRTNEAIGDDAACARCKQALILGSAGRGKEGIADETVGRNVARGGHAGHGQAETTGD